MKASTLKSRAGGRKTQEKAMQKLMANSIRISDPIVVVWPQFSDAEENLNLTETASKFNGKYCANNSTIAFSTGKEIFVTPWTSEAMATLVAHHFTHEFFYVPFSNGDYPKYEKEKWFRLKERARASYLLDYEEDCMKWCDEHQINPISEETLKHCFRMPREGVPVKHICYETTYYPATNESILDYVATTKLGRFCKNNGKVVFVYRDGHTYVTRGYKIINELITAGFKEDGLFVPFSNGEQITDRLLAYRWEEITK